VRELAYVIERAVVLSRGHVIQPEDVALPALEGSPPPAGAAWSQTPLAVAEQAVLRQVLREHGGDKRAAARTLGLSLSTLYAKLKKDQALSPCAGGGSMTFDARDAGARGVMPRAALGASHADASRAG
jgi:DNA-binding NtrC family response regulator